MKTAGLCVLAFGVFYIFYAHTQTQGYKDQQRLEAEVRAGIWQRSPYGPTEKECRRRNMAQTGVHDVQIPFDERIKFADDHGLKRPER